MSEEMSDDPLKRILQEADAAADQPPPMSTDLARRVRRLAERRRRLSFGLNAAAALVLAVGMTLLWSSPRIPPRPVPGVHLVGQQQEQLEAERMQAEITRLRREAASRLAVARRTRELMARSGRARGSKLAAEVPDPMANVRREVERTAYLLVWQADRMCRQQNLCDLAVGKYRRVVELFPDTPWATVARQRLDEIRQKGELS